MVILLGNLATGEQGITLLDPAAGTGNLLYTVMNTIENEVTATQLKLMNCLVRLSAVIAELLEHPVTFYVQDAFRPLLIDPVDITISDLPVGFYPDDENASIMN